MLPYRARPTPGLKEAYASIFGLSYEHKLAAGKSPTLEG